jgi:hypothetical protein
MAMTADEILAALLRKADAGELPARTAGAVRHLAQRVADGKPLSEMQEELVRDVGADHGLT